MRPEAGNADKLERLLESFGFGSLGISKEAFLEPHTVVQLGYPPNRIDLRTSIAGIGFEEAWSSRVEGELAGLPVFFHGREALILNKKASGRTKDLADVEALQLQEPT